VTLEAYASDAILGNMAEEDISKASTVRRRPDGLKVAGIVVAALIVARVAGQQYLPPAVANFLGLASFLGVIVLVALGVMRKKGRV
jgi:hypothetical protein